MRSFYPILLYVCFASIHVLAMEHRIIGIDEFTIKDIPAEEHWARSMLQHFQKGSMNWDRIQTSAGVKEVLGKDYIVTNPEFEIKMGTRVVKKIWKYHRFNGKGGVYWAIIVAFDKDGKTLYCAPQWDATP